MRIEIKRVKYKNQEFNGEFQGWEGVKAFLISHYRLSNDLLLFSTKFNNFS